VDLNDQYILDPNSQWDSIIFIADLHCSLLKLKLLNIKLQQKLAYKNRAKLLNKDAGTCTVYPLAMILQISH